MIYEKYQKDKKKIAFLSECGEKEKRVIIKHTYCRTSVSYIAAGAFCNCEFTSVYISKSISDIWPLAFTNCRHLESISIPNTFIRQYHDNECIDPHDSFVGDDRLSHVDVRFGKSDDWFGVVIEIIRSLTNNE